MKYFHLLLICSMGLFILGCCKHDDDDLPNGRILHEDFRDCASPYCGGWFIEIEQDTFRFIEIPDQTDIDFQQTLNLPIPVEVEWEPYDPDHPWSEVGDLIKVLTLWER